MKKAALLATVNCRQLQSGLQIAGRNPFVVFGVRDAAVLRRVAEQLAQGVRVYLYETG